METYVQGYILKLLLVKVHIMPVRDIVEDVKFIFIRSGDFVNAVE